MKRQKTYGTSKRSGRKLWLILAGILILGIILLNLFGHFFQLVRYYGDGMQPALENGQTLLIAKDAEIAEGDIVAFYYNNKLLVRRVICTGGKQLSVDRDGTVRINDEVLDEPYVAEPSIGQCNQAFPCYVPPNSVFVMGDNRAVAMDSRLKEIGTISADRILGKVLFTD